MNEHVAMESGSDLSILNNHERAMATFNLNVTYSLASNRGKGVRLTLLLQGDILVTAQKDQDHSNLNRICCANLMASSSNSDSL